MFVYECRALIVGGVKPSGAILSKSICADGAVFKELQLKQNLFDFRQIWRAAR